MKNKFYLVIAIIIAIAILAYLLGREPASEANGKIKIAEGTQPIAAPIYIANAKGYFKDEGLDVELVSFPTGKLCLDALLGGKVDFATVAETPVMHAAFKKNLQFKIIATIHRSKENTFCVCRKDSGISVPLDLKNKTIAVPLGTNAEYALSTFLDSNGLNRRDVTVINLSPPEMIGPIKRGGIAAIIAWQPHIGRCKDSLYGNATTFSFANYYEETYNLVATPLLAEEKKEISIKILKALNRAIDFMKASPKESIEIVSDRIGMDTTELTKLWPIYNFGLDLNKSLINTLEKQAAWAIKQGHQSPPVPNMNDVIASEALEKVRPEAVSLK